MNKIDFIVYFISISFAEYRNNWSSSTTSTIRENAFKSPIVRFFRHWGASKKCINDTTEERIQGELLPFLFFSILSTSLIFARLITTVQQDARDTRQTGSSDQRGSARDARFLATYKLVANNPRIYIPSTRSGQCRQASSWRSVPNYAPSWYATRVISLARSLVCEAHRNTERAILPFCALLLFSFLSSIAASSLSFSFSLLRAIFSLWLVTRARHTRGQKYKGGEKEKCATRRFTPRTSTHERTLRISRSTDKWSTQSEINRGWQTNATSTYRTADTRDDDDPQEGNTRGTMMTAQHMACANTPNKSADLTSRDTPEGRLAVKPDSSVAPPSCVSFPLLPFFLIHEREGCVKNSI